MAKADKPFTIDTLLEWGGLDSFTAPTGSFDPESTWRHTYRIWLIDKGNKGSLSIEHTPGGTSDTLSIEQSVTQASLTTHQTTADIQCAFDTLSTPQSWQIESIILDTESQPIEVTRVAHTGTVTGGNIEITIGDQTFLRPAPSVFTSNFSLFDAVQRLSGASTPPVDFDLLEDLDLLKAGQRLSYWKSREFTVNSQTLSLTGYTVVGGGVLPYRFWVDSNNRLLFVLSGIRSYILDSIT